MATAQTTDKPDGFAWSSDEILTLCELACLACTTRGVVEHLMRSGLIEPLQMDPEPCFPVTALGRLRRMRRLHLDLGVSWSSMAVVMELLDRSESLESDRR